MKKIAVYIDGQNTYFGLKTLGVRNLSRFDYHGLIQFLTDSNELVYVGYYVGQLSRENDSYPTDIRYENQQSFLCLLKINVPGLNIIRGRVMKIKNPSNNCPMVPCPLKEKSIYHEKGVDVRLAIDLVHGALQNIYDEAYLLSSDTDLIPAVNRAQAIGKKIYYIGFQHRQSREFSKVCGGSRILTLEECEQFTFRQEVTHDGAPEDLI